VVDLKKNLCRGKDSMALSITKKQYAHLIREISDALKDNIKGGGMYDFAAPEVYSEHPMSQVKFWVADGSMQGGGFFSSIGKAFKSVYKALKNTGVVDKAKQAALSKGRELGGQAIQAAAKRVDSEAAKRGFNVSGITSRAVAGAHDALHSAEGHAARAMDTAQQNVEKRMGAGMYMPHGSGMMQVGAGTGQQLVLGGTSWTKMPAHNVGMPKGAYPVSHGHYLEAGQMASSGY
jgi:hypothetical protein